MRNIGNKQGRRLIKYLSVERRARILLNTKYVEVKRGLELRVSYVRLLES